MRIARIVVPLLLVASMAVGGVLWRRSHTGEKNAKFAEVTREDLVLRVSDTGKIEPRLKVEIKSKVAGRIIAVLVEEGDWVEKGQRVALVDRTELERNLRQTEAELDAARSRLAQARIRVRHTVDSNATAVSQAEARLAAAKANLRGLEAGARPQEVAQTEAAVETARIALAEAESTLKSRRALIDRGVVRKRQTEAEVKAAKAALAQLKAGARPEEVRASETAVARAEATLKEAEASLTRARSLFAKGFLPEEKVTTAETRVTVAQADLRRSKEEVALLKEGARREEIEAAEARLQRAEADAAAVSQVSEQELSSLTAKVAQAKAELARAEAALALQKAGPRAEELDAARAQVREAEANLATVRLQTADVATADEEIVQARAAIRRLEQARDNVLTQLEDTVITAPMSGTVIDRALDPGELVASGVAALGQGQTIVTLADLSEMRVEAQFNEIDVARLHLGQEAEIKVEALPDKKIRATISQLSPAASERPAADSNIVRFEVLLVIPDPDPLLKTGMSAEVDVVVARKNGALSLPLEAVWKKGDKWLARKVLNAAEVKAWDKGNRKGKAPALKTTDVELEIGLRTDLRIEIVKGLKLGDLVRTDNLEGAEKRRKFDVP